ncbi:MAG: CHAD domain-containing protein [Steroidobacteraceae bacterium]
MQPSRESGEIAADPTAVLIRRCAAALTGAIARVERNPSRAAVHEVRVAARRLRGLLRAIRKDLHPTLQASLQFDLKNLSRSFGTLRDVSVRWRLLQEMRRRPHERGGDMSTRALGGILAEVVGMERHLQTEARQLLGSAAWNERKERIREALSSSALLAVRPRPQRRVSGRALRRSLRRVSKRLASNSIAQRDLHRLRLAVKQARYLTELLGDTPGWDEEPTCAAVAGSLRQLQTVLGDINDHFGLSEWALTAVVDVTIRRALVREIDLRIGLRIRKFRGLRKKLREPIKESARALLAAAT